VRFDRRRLHEEEKQRRETHFPFCSTSRLNCFQAQPV
jgi:hypothetical protein